MNTIEMTSKEILNPEYAVALMALCRKPFPAATGWQLKDFNDKIAELSKKISEQQVEIAIRHGAEKLPNGGAQFVDAAVPEDAQKEFNDLNELKHEIPFTPFRLPEVDISGKPIHYEPIIQILLSKLLIK